MVEIGTKERTGTDFDSQQRMRSYFKRVNAREGGGKVNSCSVTARPAVAVKKVVCHPSFHCRRASSGAAQDPGSTSPNV